MNKPLSVCTNQKVNLVNDISVLIHFLSLYYTSIDLVHSSKTRVQSFFATAANAEWLFSRFFHEETFIFVASRFTCCQPAQVVFKYESESESGPSCHLTCNATNMKVSSWKRRENNHSAFAAVAKKAWTRVFDEWTRSIRNSSGPLVQEVSWLFRPLVVPKIS